MAHQLFCSPEPQSDPIDVQVHQLRELLRTEIFYTLDADVFIPVQLELL
jgi:hypothetical protein